MEIIFSTEDGTEFARFADVEDLSRKFVAVCVAADDEITALKQQRDAAANSALDHASKYSNIVQAITDPENQPSQYGTVTLAMYNELKQQHDEQAERIKELEAALESRKSTNAGWNAYHALRQRIADAPVVAHITEDGKVFSNGFVRDTDKPLISKEDLQG